MSSDYPLTRAEFDEIYSKVTRLSVEVLLKDEKKGVYLTLRDIEPCKGQWHIPGGTVLFGEPVLETVKRIAKREINIDVKGAQMIDYLEYPSHYLNGMDSPVGLVFLVTDYTGEPNVNQEAVHGSWFTTVPENMHADQDEFLTRKGFLKKA